MTRSKASATVIADRLAWLERMLTCIRGLPIGDADAFFADERNVWTAESCLRRALEAVLDIGRHVLAKGYATPVAEYRQIARELERHAVIRSDEAALLEQMAGYRNRMVHFYHDVTPAELFALCSGRLGDLVDLGNAFRRWARAHPERLDSAVG